MRKNEHGLYEVDVDGQKYEFQKWNAEDAMDALLDIAGIMGKPLGAGASAWFEKDEDGGDLEAKKAIGKILEALSDRIGPNKAVIKSLIRKLTSETVFCNGAKVSFNSHYEDKLGHLFKVVKAALEVQFGNFFAGLGGTVTKAKEAIRNFQPQA